MVLMTKDIEENSEFSPKMIEEFRQLCKDLDFYPHKYKELGFLFAVFDSSGSFPLEIVNNIESIIAKTKCLKYHLDNYIKQEKKYLKIAEKHCQDELFKRISVNFIPDVPLCEFEAFLFQMRACLEIFSKTIGFFFNETPTKIRTLKKVLAQKKKFEYQKYPNAGKILDILSNHDWLKEYESKGTEKCMRDIVTHYSTFMLKTSKILIPEKASKKKPEKLMYKKKLLREIMEDSYKNFLRLIKEVYSILFAEYLSDFRFV